jgi:hypothetical protein
MGAAEVFMRPELAGALAVTAALVVFSPSDAGIPANGAPSNGAGPNGLSVNGATASARTQPRGLRCKPPSVAKVVTKGRFHAWECAVPRRHR